MTLRITLALSMMVLVSGCSTEPYLFGHSSYGHYYGGQGENSLARRYYVPKELQRERPMYWGREKS